MTQVLSFKIVSPVRLFVASAIFALFVLAYPIPVQAAQLTESQISSILNLLVAFDVKESVINDVSEILGGGPIQNWVGNEDEEEDEDNNDEDIEENIDLIAPSSSGSSQYIAIGSTYTIQWEAEGMPSNAFLGFYLENSNGKTYMIPQSGPMALPYQGAYNWKVMGPVCAKSGNYWSCASTLAPGKYRLIVKAFTTTDSYGQPSGVVADDKSGWFMLTGESSGLPVPNIDYFKASATSIVAGQSSVLYWSASNAQDGGCLIYSSTNNQSHLNTANTSAQGSLVVYPSVTQKYTLKCHSSWKDGYPTDTEAVTVDVSNTYPMPTCSISADKTSYVYGESIKISWTSANASYATWLADTSGKDNLVLGTDKLSASGSQTIVANVTGYPYVTMKVYGSGGSATCSKTFYVSNASPMQDDETSRIIPHAAQVGSFGFVLAETINPMNLAAATAVVVDVPFTALVAILADFFYGVGIR